MHKFDTIKTINFFSQR